MKKPDRFERETWKQFKRWANGPQDDGWINGVTIKLLRREHAWMVRMLKKVEAWSCEQLADNDDVIAAILEQLTQRRK